MKNNKNKPQDNQKVDRLHEIIHDVEVDIQACEYLKVNKKEVQVLRNSFYELTEFLEPYITGLEEYKEQHVKATEEKYENDYKRFKQEYKAQIDLEALCCAVADAEQEYHDKHVKPLVEVLEAFVNSTYTGCTKEELNQIRIKAEQCIKTVK